MFGGLAGLTGLAGLWVEEGGDVEELDEVCDVAAVDMRSGR